MKLALLLGITLYLFADCAAEYQGTAVQTSANTSEEVLEWPPSEERVDLMVSRIQRLSVKVEVVKERKKVLRKQSPYLYHVRDMLSGVMHVFLSETNFFQIKSVDEHPELFEHGMYWYAVADLAQYSGMGPTRTGSLKYAGEDLRRDLYEIVYKSTPHFLNMAYMILDEDSWEELTVFDVVHLKRQIYAKWKCTDPQVDLVECLEQTKRILAEARPYLSSHEEL